MNENTFCIGDIANGKHVPSRKKKQTQKKPQKFTKTTKFP